MKYGVLTGVKQAEVRECPIPELGDNQLLVRQHACNICTSDYGQWLGTRTHIPFPMAGGHENAGEIIEKGKDVNDEFQVGDHVAFSYPFCGLCEACRIGNTMDCKYLYDYMTASYCGVPGIFGFAEYKVIDARFAVKVSPDLPYGEAGFLEPVATVVHGMKKVAPTKFDTVVVIGAGTMGILNAQVARFYGARVIITEMMPKKLAVAKALGFETVDVGKKEPVEAVRALTDGKGADIVIIAVGATSANTQALQMLSKAEGKILFFAAGYPAPELKVGSNDIHYKSMKLIGTYDATMTDFMDAAEILSRGGVNVTPLIEATIPLDDIQKAFETASTPGAYRVCVEL